MKAFILIESPSLDEKKISNILITFWVKTTGRYDYLIYCENVTAEDVDKIVKEIIFEQQIERLSILLGEA